MLIQKVHKKNRFSNNLTKTLRLLKVEKESRIRIWNTKNHFKRDYEFYDRKSVEYIK